MFSRNNLFILRAVLKFTRVEAQGIPTSLHFGTCKVNVHDVGHTLEPMAAVPTTGAAEISLLTEESLDDIADICKPKNLS